MGDVLVNLTDAVADLEATLDGLLAACTDPEATDVAELLQSIREQRTRLYALEQRTEEACAKAMLADMAETPTLRVERHRTTDRKAWDHETWQRDVRTKVLQAVGLKGAQGIVTATGEVAPADVLYDALRQVEAAHGAAAPKTTALRALGLDARDYCESSPGAWKVRITRMAEEGDGSCAPDQ